MEPFEVLSETDKKIFLQYIKDFGDAKPEAPLSTILRFWNTNKQFLFDAFGQKLILEKEIQVRKTNDEIIGSWNDAPISQQKAYEDIVSGLRAKAEELFPIRPDEARTAQSFGYIPSHPNEYYLLSDRFLTRSNFVTNTYSEETFYIPTRNGKRIKVQKGCHLMPTLRKICHEFGIPEEIYESVRLFQSQLTNNAYAYGTLCLSIAPIDFLTMSDNDCNWNSCMSWVDHTGEYRQGTIEMMNSSCVLVAYLKSDTPYILWSNSQPTLSNKKWRQLVIANRDIILGNRHYPYQYPDLEAQILSWVRELLGGDEQFSSIILPICNLLHKDNNPGGYDYIWDFETVHMYNDIYEWRNAYLSNNFFTNYPKEYSLNFSGEAECMSCGEVIYGSEFDTSWVKCIDCNRALICNNCGSFILPECDDYYTNDNEEVFCCYCVQNSNEICICPCCQQPYYDSDLETIEYLANDSLYNHFISACSNCFPAFGEFGPKDEDGTYNAKNFTTIAIDFCNDCGEYA